LAKHIPSHKRLHIFLIMMLLLLLSFSAPLSNASDDLPWPIFRGDPSGTGVSESSLSDDLVEYWSFTADDRIISTPALSKERVFFGTNGGNFYCLDRMNGELLWTFEDPTSFEASPALTKSTVLIGSTGGIARLLNATNGDEIWNYSVGGPIHASCGLVDYSAVLASDNGSVIALETSDGSEKWSFLTGYYVYSMPAISDGRLYFGSCDKKLYCLDMETGTELWNHSSAYVTSTPAVSYGRVYFGAYDTNIYCLDALTGVVVWSHPVSDTVFSSAAVHDNKVFVGIQDGTVICLDAGNGDEIWSYQTNGTVNSSPAIADGKVIIGSADGSLYIFDADSGDIILRFETGDEIVGSAAIASGRIYFGSADGKLYCLGRRLQDMSMEVITESNYITSGSPLNITVKVMGPNGALVGATVSFGSEFGEMEPSIANTTDEGIATSKMITPNLNSSTINKVSISVILDGYHPVNDTVNILLLPSEEQPAAEYDIDFASLPENVSSNEEFEVAVLVTNKDTSEPVSNTSVIVTIGSESWFGVTDGSGVANVDVKAPSDVDDFILKVEIPSQPDSLKEVTILVEDEVVGPPDNGNGAEDPNGTNDNNETEVEESDEIIKDPLFWLVVGIFIIVVVSMVALRSLKRKDGGTKADDGKVDKEVEEENK